MHVYAHVYTQCVTHARARRSTFEVTFLGTASSQPTVFRNVTSLYVDMFERGGMLMDVGEDTLGQLKRR